MTAGLFEKNLGDTEVLTMFLAITCLGYLARDRAEILYLNRHFPSYNPTTPY
jgi:hypothetical protein